MDRAELRQFLSTRKYVKEIVQAGGSQHTFDLTRWGNQLQVTAARSGRGQMGGKPPDPGWTAGTP